MTSYSEPADHSERVNDVLARAVTLSDELQTTIAELTHILRAESKGVTDDGQPID